MANRRALMLLAAALAAGTARAEFGPTDPAEPVPEMATTTSPVTGPTDQTRALPEIKPSITLLPPVSAARSAPAIEPRVAILEAPAGAKQPTPPTPALLTMPTIDTPTGTDPARSAGRLAEELLSDEIAARAEPGFAEQVPIEESKPEIAPLKLLGEELEPGTFAQLTWFGTETFTSAGIPSAVLVAHGAAAGPVVCLTAAIHGDELNGIETVRRIMHSIDPTHLNGTLIGVPIVNVQGFHRGSRYLPDRRDLNRFFPGNPTGSSASRIAYSLFYSVITRCNALIDLHTGSFHRTNLPQLRADLNRPGALALTRSFGPMVVLHNGGLGGTLRAAATRAGIPAVTLEAGGPMQVEMEAVSQSERAIRHLLDSIGVYPQPGLTPTGSPGYYQTRWVRADHGGILSTKVALGTDISLGDLLGSVTDPITNQTEEIRSPITGRVIGMALDQFVMPGYATFHVGIEAPVEAIIGTPAAADPEFEAAETDTGFDES